MVVWIHFSIDRVDTISCSKRIYERLFDIPNLNHAAAIHYTAQEEAERAAFLRLRAKPVIVPNGIDWETYRHLPARGSFRERLGLDDQNTAGAFPRSYQLQERTGSACTGFCPGFAEYPGARLAIVGPDNEGYGSKVKQWCGSKVSRIKFFFVDHMGPEEVKQAYVDADVFVLPSYTENFGMTVVEAMACGCPVVISDQVNIWREIQEEGAGLVVGLEPREIAKAICRVLADKDAAKDNGNVEAVWRRKRRYAWPRIVDQ